MDFAVRLHTMYVETCEACERNGVPAPTPEEWIDLIEKMVADPLIPSDSVSP